MSAHLQLLDRADGEGRSLFMLTEPYPYRLGPGCTIIVPRGYKTNFGTIPRWFSWIVSPTQLREAAIVHDWLCNESFDGDEVTVKSGFSRPTRFCTKRWRDSASVGSNDRLSSVPSACMRLSPTNTFGRNSQRKSQSNDSLTDLFDAAVVRRLRPGC
jgi:hypothetical protein